MRCVRGHDKLAALVEYLELERKPTVTFEEISRTAEEQGLKTPGRIIAHRLARLGRLLPTPVRDTWEFAPAERADASPDADPRLPLKALLSASNEDLPRGPGPWVGAGDSRFAASPTLGGPNCSRPTRFPRTVAWRRLQARLGCPGLYEELRWLPTSLGRRAARRQSGVR